MLAGATTLVGAGASGPSMLALAVSTGVRFAPAAVRLDMMMILDGKGEKKQCACVWVSSYCR